MIRSALRLSLVLLVLGAIAVIARNSVHAASAPSISLNVQNTAPRQVEETTEKAVARDYAASWKVMVDALDQNRTDGLANGFVGTAHDKLKAGIEAQRKTGVHQQIVEKGHSVDVVFYSPEGSAMELYDTVQLQLQVMDGSKILHSEDATVHYVALLTAAENSWKVRLLEAVPSF